MGRFAHGTLSNDGMNLPKRAPFVSSPSREEGIVCHERDLKALVVVVSHRFYLPYVESRIENKTEMRSEKGISKRDRQASSMFFTNSNS